MQCGEGRKEGECAVASVEVGGLPWLAYRGWRLKDLRRICEESLIVDLTPLASKLRNILMILVKEDDED